MNTTLLLVDSDLDGAGSAVVALRALNESVVTLRPMRQEAVDAAVAEALDSNRYDEVIIADLSPSPAMCARLHEAYKRNVKVICVDHHDTARHIKEYLWGIWTEDDICAAALLWDKLMSPSEDPELRRFVMAVNAYDCWITCSPYRRRGEDLNRLFHFLGFDRFVLTFGNEPSADADRFKEVLEVLREKEAAEIKAALEQPAYLVKDKDGHMFVYTVSLSPLVSQIGHALLERYPTAEYAAVVNPSTERISLRSRPGGIDVSIIAARHGGGGRANTAALSLPLKNVITDSILAKLA